MISSAHRTASEIAATVAGTRFPPSYGASFRAARDASCNQQQVLAALVHLGIVHLSLCVRLACPDPEVGTTIGVQQKLMRHADIRTTMNIYGDAASADMREAHGKSVGLALNGTETARKPV